jgi:hypothetical protein
MRETNRNCFDKINITPRTESFALREVEWVDDIFGYDWGLIGACLLPGVN